MTNNKRLGKWLQVAFPEHYLYANMRKDLIPDVLSRLFGSILFIPSRYEGFSLSLIEGMSQGLVPVSYRVGVAPEIIKDGENGFLVSSHEEAEEKIRELLSNSEKRMIMAKSAKESVLRFKSDVIAGKLISLYKTIKLEAESGRKGQ